MYIYTVQHICSIYIYRNYLVHTVLSINLARAFFVKTFHMILSSKQRPYFLISSKNPHFINNTFISWCLEIIYQANIVISTILFTSNTTEQIRIQQLQGNIIKILKHNYGNWKAIPPMFMPAL